jgi:hypothetical protein
MIDEERYFDALQKVIKETKSADGITERLNEVLERLDQLSAKYTKDLQAETGIRYEKDKELYSIWQFPPYRLLTMIFILSRWVEKCSGEPTFSLRMEKN